MKSVRRHPKVRKNTLTAQKYQDTNTDKNTKGEECIEEYREALNTEWVDTEDKDKEDQHE